MARLNSWLSADVMHALGWALIHSLWQCLGVAALTALLMAFSRRPSARYIVGVGALALMLSLPVVTFFVLLKPSASVQATVGASSAPSISAAPTTAVIYPVALISSASSRTVADITRSVQTFGFSNVLPWLVSAWLCGVILLSLRLAGGFLLLENRRRNQSTALSPHILAMCHELQRQFGLDRAVHYLECGWLHAPAVIGWLHPVVFLPVTALTGLSEPQLRAVIAHELAHIRRFDAFVNLFQILVETLLFYHPAVWWLTRRIRAERELACDEIAVSISGDRLEYARALTRMAEWKDVPLLAMAANRGSLSTRVFHILGRKSNGAGPRMLGLTGAVIFLIAGLAAANALYGVAHPMSALAKASKTVAVSSETAFDHFARQPFQLGVRATTLPVPNQTGHNDEVMPPAQPKFANTVQTEKLIVPEPDLSRLASLQSLTVPMIAADDAGGPPGSNNQSVVLLAPTNNGNAAEKTSAPPNTSTAAPTKTDSDRPIIYNCRYKNPVWGRVISPEAINMTSFNCSGLGISADPRARAGSCPNWIADPSVNEGSLFRRKTTPFFLSLSDCKFDVTLNVRLADPADASKMQAGKIVSLAGHFTLTTVRGVPYLTVTDAKVLYFDPFERPASRQVAPTAPAPQPAATSLPVASAAPVPSAENVPAATPGGASPNAPVTGYTCYNNSVYGRVISPEAIQMPGFACLLSNGQLEARSPINYGSCPYTSTYYPFAKKARGPGGVLTECTLDIRMNVQLANPADSAKMQQGKTVRLAGEFRVEIKDRAPYLYVTNARVIWTDPFDRQTLPSQPSSGSSN